MAVGATATCLKRQYSNFWIVSYCKSKSVTWRPWQALISSTSNHSTRDKMATERIQIQTGRAWEQRNLSTFNQWPLFSDASEITEQQGWQSCPAHWKLALTEDQTFEDQANLYLPLLASPSCRCVKYVEMVWKVYNMSIDSQSSATSLDQRTQRMGPSSSLRLEPRIRGKTWTAKGPGDHMGPHHEMSISELWL